MKKNIRRLFLIPVLLLAALSIQAGSQPARDSSPEPPPADTPPPPDFTHVTDILGGRRTLFPVDDLLVSYQNENYTVWPISAFTIGGRINSTNNAGDCGFGATSGNGWLSGVGRMFNLPYAVGLVVAVDQYTVISAVDPNNPNSCGSQLSFPNPVGANPFTIPDNQMAQGDFNGDGFADFAPLLGGLPYPVTAQDVNNLNAGLYTGLPGDASDPNADVIALAAGDFDGNGDDELARFSMSYGGGFASNTVNVILYDLQRASNGGWQFVNVGQAQIPLPNATATVYAVAGTFSGATNPSNGIFYDQLLLAADGIGLLTIQPTVQSTDPLSIAVSVADQTSTSSLGSSIVGVQSARLDFFAPTEQVVLGSNTSQDGNGSVTSNVAVLNFDPSLNISIASSVHYDLNFFNIGFIRQTGIAVGNFDQATGQNTPLNLQIASLCLLNPNSDSPYALVVPIAVDASDNFKLSLPSNAEITFITQLKGTPGGASQGWIPRIVAGDLQGRSLVLGDPTSFSVRHTQPKVILGMPPQHVDYVTPVDDAGPQVLNLSAVVAGGFASSYTASDNSTVSSSSIGTTSWTHAVTQTSSAGYTVGGAATGSVTVKATESAGFMHNKTVATRYNTYATNSFSLSVGTGFDDNLIYADERHNVYVYPVIGQTACPADNPNCSESERLPLTLVLSGPDQIKASLTQASTQEWFQPMWEPGNIFSYPWTWAQIQTTELQDSGQTQTANLLTSSTPTELTTQDAPYTEGTSWQSGSSSSQSTGITNNIRWGASVSVSSKPGPAGGASVSASVAYNGSKGMSTLNTSTTTLGQSTGISISSAGTFLPAVSYEYGFQPFIFGSDPASGTFQTISLGTDNVTSGILQAAYTTDLTSNQGSWWQGAYPLPDLALNHPARWSVSAGYTNAGASCRPTNNPSRPYSCATLGLNDASPENLWNSDFFWMKGLLITPATGPAEGPQLSEATAGDQLRLQARVYNYSLKSMAGNVTVQFYGQPWDTSNNTPIGNSFLIENVELGPIPAYGGSEPNWQVAETTRLDTAAYSDQHLIFWMLVVLKDAQGNPLPEMSGHGLTGVPPTVNSFTEAATWIEPYSNNLGYYHSAFYIAPQNAGLGATARAPVGEGNLAIKRFTAEPKRALLNKPVSVSAVLRVGDLALDHVVVSFYDGDPDHGGRLFDEERLAHIRAHEVAEARVPFRAETCGVHTLYVKTYPQVNTAKTTLSVRSKPLLPTVQGLISQTRQLALPRHKHDKNNYLLDLLYEARQSIKHHDITGALNKLAEYRVSIEKMRGHTIPAAQADQILAQLGRISSCTG